jgi:hypothetical protein
MMHVVEQHMLVTTTLLLVGVHCKKTFFQQDGAEPHIEHAILNAVNEYFSNHVITDGFPGHFGYQWSWPPDSSELNLCDYSL